MQYPELNCVVSVSGFRGVVGETIDASTVAAIAACYGVEIAQRGTVILGQDSRPTGHHLRQAAAAALRSVGCDVIDVGIVATPTVPMALLHHQAQGGIQLSASHNPVEWNALKLFNQEGRNIDRGQLDALLARYHQGSDGLAQSWHNIGSFVEDHEALQRHHQTVLNYIDRDVCRRAALPVLVDSVNGAGSLLAPQLLRDLGCQVTAQHTDPDQIFPRNPEPTEANCREVADAVLAHGAAVGFIQDPDADRLAPIDETGRYIGEEYTLALCAWARLQAAGPGAVAVTNVSTSGLIDAVAERCQATVVRSAVGEANVVDGMQAHDAVIGGEGNGGVIDPRVVLGRDSHIGIALIIELLARTGQTMSQLVAELPPCVMIKAKIGLDRTQVAEHGPRLADAPFAAGSRCDLTDGYKYIWPDRWVHLRASGTEPVSRIIAEAPTLAEAEQLCESCAQALGQPLLAEHL